MTIKKFTVIAVAGAALLAGAIGLSMRLTSQNEMEMEIPETAIEQGTTKEDGSKILENMENTPLYYDDTKVLLLPLRNVMEGLGGSVVWNAETKMTEVTYRGRTLMISPGNAEAILNGYEITLPETAEMINGCLYADEKLISAYYTGEVDFDVENRRVTLQTKDNSVPVLAMHIIRGEKDGRAYEIEVPVIVGLNDGMYEKNLNESFRQELQAYGDVFLAEGADGGKLQLKAKVGLCAKEFLSIWWEGAKGDTPVKFAKNFDLMGQKTVTLADLMESDSLEKARMAGGEGWTEDRFYLTAEGGLVLMKGSNESSQNMYYWTTEGEQPEWKENFRELFRKKS